MLQSPKKRRKPGSAWRQANNAFFSRVAATVPADSVVLDVGAGHGYLRQYFGGQYFSTDVYPYEGLDFLSDLSDSPPLRENSIDVILLNNVLEHVAEPGKLLSAIAYALRPEGRLFLTVPFIIKLHQTPYDFYRYTHFLLQKLLTEAGFHDLQMEAVYTPEALLRSFFFEAFTPRLQSSVFRRWIRSTIGSTAWVAIRAGQRLAPSPAYRIEAISMSLRSINPWVTGYHVEAKKPC
jgi:SAM-dependent methyltransferase